MAGLNRFCLICSFEGTPLAGLNSVFLFSFFSRGNPFGRFEWCFLFFRGTPLPVGGLDWWVAFWHLKPWFLWGSMGNRP